MKKTSLLLWSAAVAVLLSATAPAMAQAAYPARPVTIVVPFAAGGGTDLLARYWGSILQKELGQSVIIDVRAGAGGSIGMAYVARAPADGYTLLIATPAFLVNPFTIKNTGYDPVKDFAPLAVVGASNIAVVVPNESSIKTVRDMLDQSRAKPGVLSVGNAGTASVGQMAAAYFQTYAKVKFTEIPYKGASQAVVDLMGSRTHAQFEAFPSILTYIKSGKVRAIAVTSKQRSELLPDVPTVDETVPGYDASSWTAFLVPANTPRPIVEKLNAVFRKAAVDPAVKAHLAEFFGSAPVNTSTTEAAAFISTKLKENEMVTKAMGMVAE